MFCFYTTVSMCVHEYAHEPLPVWIYMDARGMLVCVCTVLGGHGVLEAPHF